MAEISSGLNGEEEEKSRVLWVWVWVWVLVNDGRVMVDVVEYECLVVVGVRMMGVRRRFVTDDRIRDVVVVVKEREEAFCRRRRRRDDSMTTMMVPPDLGLVIECTDIQIVAGLRRLFVVS